MAQVVEVAVVTQPVIEASTCPTFALDACTRKDTVKTLCSMGLRKNEVFLIS